MSVKPQQPGPPSVDPAASTIPMGPRILAIILRTLFLGALVVVTVRLSSPQSETIWTAYETLGDLIRLALGFAVCLWIVIHLFMLPKGAEGYRTWVYLGLVGAPGTVKASGAPTVRTRRSRQTRIGAVAKKMPRLEKH
jgi:hypothetical protein